MPKCYYSLIRYVPDSVRGEFFNVGVLVLSASGDIELKLIPAREGRRMRRLVGEPGELSALYEFADAVEKATPGQFPLAGMTAGPSWDIDLMRAAARSWAGVIQLTDPQPAVVDHPRQLALDVYEQTVARASIAREASGEDRRHVRSVTRKLLVRDLSPYADLPPGRRPEVLPRFTVEGEHDFHSFDLAVANGRPLELIEAAALDQADERETVAALKVHAWVIDDVRRRQDARLSVVISGRRSSPVLFNRYEKVYRELGATVVPFEYVADFSQEVAKRFALRH